MKEGIKKENKSQMKVIIWLNLLTNVICFASLNHYVKMSKTDVAGHDIFDFECGEGYAKKCDIEHLAFECNSNPRCRGFNSNGFLKSCASGCEAGCCYDVTQNVDLYIRKGYLPPDEWQDDVNSGRMLYANPEPHFCFLPEIANGYLCLLHCFKAGYSMENVEISEKHDYHHQSVDRL